jgi:hypothetical protein
MTASQNGGQGRGPAGGVPACPGSCWPGTGLAARCTDPGSNQRTPQLLPRAASRAGSAALARPQPDPSPTRLLVQTTTTTSAASAARRPLPSPGQRSPSRTTTSTWT